MFEITIFVMMEFHTSDCVYFFQWQYQILEWRPKYSNESDYFVVMKQLSDQKVSSIHCKYDV